jgi:hypothetical protein
MPSHLTGAARELAVEIVRCPVLEQCIAAGGEALPCHRVAAGLGGPHQVRWFPEPWVGHLTEAPLLFVSSNPASGGPTISEPGELSVASSDDDIVDWADGAFDADQAPGVADGAYLVNAKGRRGTWVSYWGWVLRRAREILPKPVTPGRGYAITEVVHCGTPRQKGVQEALQTCTSRYLERVLAASPAKVLVLVGSVPRSAFAEHLNLDVPDHLLGPVEVAGRERLLVSVRHPNSRGGVKSFQGQLTDAQLAQVRGALASTS